MPAELCRAVSRFVFLRPTDDISGRRAILEESKAKLVAFCPKLEVLYVQAPVYMDDLMFVNPPSIAKRGLVRTINDFIFSILTEANQTIRVDL